MFDPLFSCQDHKNVSQLAHVFLYQPITIAAISEPDMKSIDADEFKEQCLAVIHHLNDEAVAITKNGKPVAMLTKYDDFEDDSPHLIGSLKGNITVYVDNFSTGVHYPEDCHKYNRDENLP